MFTQKVKRIRVVVLCSLLVVVLGVLTSSSKPIPLYAEAPGFDAQEQHMLTLLNQYRVANGKGQLVHDPVLQAQAETYAQTATVFAEHSSHPHEVIAYVSGSDGQEGAYNALHNCTWFCWKQSPPHNNIILNSAHTRVGIGHANRSCGSFVNPPETCGPWYWVIQFDSGSPPPPPGPPNISQVGRYIPTTYNPALNSRPTFEVTLKNNSPYEARLNEVFLRLRHPQTGVELKATLWFPSSGHAVIAPGGTRTFTGRPPVLPHRGFWHVERVEMQTASGAWLPGIDQQGRIMVHEANFALNRPVFVHSVRDGSGNSPPKVNDGSPLTRWESEWYDDQMIEIDLGQTRTIDTVMLHWESAYAKVFRVKIGSNCGSSPHQCTWTQVYSTSNGKGGDSAITFNEINGRWVKIELVQRGTPWGFSLWEFGVYNRYTG